MRHLFYTNYESGRSGLSNGIMSIEVGVVLAFLTNRFLVLDGNVSPPANVVTYGNGVDDERPSRITDLIDLPVPWAEPDPALLGGARSLDLTSASLGDAVFHLPGMVDARSEDARRFANGRETWLSPEGALADVPVLRVAETSGNGAPTRNNLTFYSYFFYLDDETRRSTYRMLARMAPKPPLAELAGRVARDLGRFNAVHMRRGDFKVTYGVTVLDRQPWEAIEALDHHFRRDDPLVILTDEAADPFFDQIKAAYPRHVFIDHHILSEYGDEFRRLPTRDGIALAYLSQLVAAESADFIGTMTSTYTALVQRLRGNRGKVEPFKFLWNELPEPADRVERGRHRISECIPLDRGIMIEEGEGPYSWNRYSPRLAASWMREWPESFLTDEALASGRLTCQRASPAGSPYEVRPVVGVAERPSRVEVVFEDLGVSLHLDAPDLAARLAEAFGSRVGQDPRNVIASVRIERSDGAYVVHHGERQVAHAATYDELARAVKRTIAPVFVHARRRHVWLDGSAFLRDGHAVIVAGDLGDQADWLPDALCSSGWELLVDDVVPVRVGDLTVTPFGRSGWPRGAATRVERTPRPLSAIVVATRRLHYPDRLVGVSPAVGAAELIARSIDFASDRERALDRICALAEACRVGELSFSSAAGAAAAISAAFAAARRRMPERGTSA